ncbi:MAG: hypothetical protein LBJ18_01490 [Rickettsiales bacterium]|jgi:hypothetical protein|nr:hypothetical protein [Rickettsiales bacterium]
MRVSGDTTGFRTMAAARLNDAGFSAKGSVIADRANITGAIHIGKNMELKASGLRTVSGFLGLSAHSLYTPFVAADEMSFMNGFGLTVSGELLMSTTSPLKLGSWNFPSTTPPKFASLTLARARIPKAPDAAEFDTLIKGGWKAATPQSRE